MIMRLRIHFVINAISLTEKNRGHLTFMLLTYISFRGNNRTLSFRITGPRAMPRAVYEEKVKREATPSTPARVSDKIYILLLVEVYLIVCCSETRDKLFANKGLKALIEAL